MTTEELAYSIWMNEGQQAESAKSNYERAENYLKYSEYMRDAKCDGNTYALFLDWELSQNLSAHAYEHLKQISATDIKFLWDDEHTLKTTVRENTPTYNKAPYEHVEENSDENSDREIIFRYALQKSNSDFAVYAAAMFFVCVGAIFIFVWAWSRPKISPKPVVFSSGANIHGVGDFHVVCRDGWEPLVYASPNGLVAVCTEKQSK